MTDRSRVVLLALDALDARLLHDWLDDGLLPNLAAFRARAVRLGVRSDGATLHGAIWPTFASGQPAGVHGSYFWMQWLAEAGRIVRSSHPAFSFEPFWGAAADAGRRAIVIDVPYTPVLARPRTWTVLGWGVHDEVEEGSYPHAFLPAVRNRYGRHPLSADTMHSLDPASKLRMARSMTAGVELRLRLIRDILRRRDWDLVVTTFGEFHKASHYLARDETLAPGITNRDALLDVARAFDRGLPDLLDAAGADTDIAVFALHGMDARMDYAPFGPELAAHIAGRPAGRTPRPDLVRRVRDILPRPVVETVWAHAPARLRSARYARLSFDPASAGRPVFPVPFDSAIALRLSIRGREPAGLIPPGEADTWKRRIEAFAKGLTGDDGRPAFAEQIDLPAAFPGPRAHRLPDVLLMPDRDRFGTQALHLPGGGTIGLPEQAARNGAHNGTGFCLYRPAGTAAARRAEITPLDFAPTVLSRLGVPARPDHHGTPFL